ncbi:hypothetical protein [Maribacter sedimenticola]|nr:hypothetical protein [Maribacter sedimenticola]
MEQNKKKENLPVSRQAKGFSYVGRRKLASAPTGPLLSQMSYLRTTLCSTIRHHMNLKLSLLIFLWVILNSFGQQCEYQEYFLLTDLAKDQTSKKDYKAAKNNFKQAFSKTSFPLGHDLSYALYVADETNDDEWALLIAKQLAKGGIPLRYFVKFKKRKWYKRFVSEFHSLNQYYEENFNLEIRVRFLELSKKDADFTEKYHSWRVREIELTKEELINDATERLNDFKEFNQKYGFPNEQTMGYNYNRRLNRIEPYPVGAMMIHIYQMGVLLYQDSIPNFVCTGGLHPSYKKNLKTIRGFGNSTGVKQEIEARFAKFRGEPINH